MENGMDTNSTEKDSFGDKYETESFIDEEGRINMNAEEYRLERLDDKDEANLEELNEIDDDSDMDYDDDFDQDDTETKTNENGRKEKHSSHLEMDLTEEELDDIADTAIEAIRELLYYFNSEDVDIEEYEGDEKELIFDVVGDNLAMLIGRHGRTLEALQYLVSAIVSKRVGYHYPVVVDVEGYVNRRKQKLIALAKSSAARAIRQKRSVRLRPMSPYERRVVHMTLKDEKRIRTESEGADPNRQVVIYLT
jgi:spoIIIJ-associated protein